MNKQERNTKLKSQVRRNEESGHTQEQRREMHYAEVAEAAKLHGTEKQRSVKSKTFGGSRQSKKAQ